MLFSGRWRVQLHLSDHRGKTCGLRFSERGEIYHSAQLMQHLLDCCILWIYFCDRLSSRFKTGVCLIAGSGNSYTTSDLSRKSGDIIAEALRHPVTVTQRNKPRLVLLNIEDYERLMRQSDLRAVGTVDNMSDALLEEFEAAADTYAETEETVR